VAITITRASKYALRRMGRIVDSHAPKIRFSLQHLAARERKDWDRPRSTHLQQVDAYATDGRLRPFEESRGVGHSP
jgi:hypothetical protein